MKIDFLTNTVIDRFAQIDLKSKLVDIARELQINPLFFIANDQFPISLSHIDVILFEQSLEAMSGLDKIGIFLHSYGGSINSARRIGLLLQNNLRHFPIYVPYKAVSAGTIVCLAAKDIYMGTCSELSPIDPQLQSYSSDYSTSTRISPLDVRAYFSLMDEWFDIKDESHKLQLIDLVTKHIPPASLGAFFRASKQVKAICEELMLLNYNNTSGRSEIITQLSEGFYSHDFSILLDDARRIGLSIQPMSKDVDLRTRQLFDRFQDVFGAINDEYGHETRSVINGFLFHQNFLACHVVEGFGEQGSPDFLPTKRRSQWFILKMQAWT